MEKYEFVEEKSLHFNNTFIIIHRIKALRDIPRFNVKAGDLGGWIQYESNLSQEGDAWVAHEAIVYEGALVAENAFVRDNAKIYGEAVISGDAIVGRNVKVFGSARIHGDASIRGQVRVYGNAEIYGNADIFETSPYYSTSYWCMIYENAQIFGNSRIRSDHFRFRGNSKVYGDARILTHVELYGNAQIHGKAIYTYRYLKSICEGDITGDLIDYNDLKKYSIKEGC